MKTYKVVAFVEVKETFNVEAETKEEAKQLVMDGEVDSNETENADVVIDSIIEI